MARYTITVPFFLSSVVYPSFSQTKVVFYRQCIYSVRIIHNGKAYFVYTRIPNFLPESHNTMAFSFFLVYLSLSKLLLGFSNVLPTFSTKCTKGLYGTTDIPLIHLPHAILFFHAYSLFASVYSLMELFLMEIYSWFSTHCSRILNALPRSMRFYYD